MDKTRTFSAGLVLILCFVAVFASGYMIGHRKVSELEVKMEKAKQIFSVGLTDFVSGKVTSINGNTLEIDIGSSGLYGDEPQMRRVHASDSTSLLKMDQKPDSQRTQEWITYQKDVAVAQVGEVLLPPPPLMTVEISLSDIKVGEYINVESKDDIGNNQDIDASKITVQHDSVLAGPGAGL